MTHTLTHIFTHTSSLDGDKIYEAKFSRSIINSFMIAHGHTNILPNHSIS